MTDGIDIANELLNKVERISFYLGGLINDGVSEEVGTAIMPILLIIADTEPTVEEAFGL